MENQVEAKGKWNILNEKLHDRNAEIFEKKTIRCGIEQNCNIPPDKSCGQKLKVGLK